jgi:flagellar basal body-associated protein FliL
LPGKIRRPLYEREEVEPVGIAVVALIILVVVALIAIPILVRVFGEAARRNPNQPEGEGSDETGDHDRGS